MTAKEWDLGYCGINCSKCDLLKQNECAGCKGQSDHQWSENCKFRPCATGKGHQYCFECNTFPCERITEFEYDQYEHHTITVDNLRRMREIGLDAWIAEQPKVMFCPGWKK